ncbi:aldo/keto reductase [Anaerotruncus colihominis]|uniref:aldo/keto reductase n=1 Tax=Anaerotruncus colihominis TaxID=169435 RepID=UPI00242CBB43|nr:aldo/keto reductase [Anaerotruncus colihominis]
MENTKRFPKIALGTWSWGVGAVGGDQVFGNHLGEADLKAVFDTAMKEGLNLWDTATVYGMGASEDILGAFTKTYPCEDVILSTKFTPQIAGSGADPVAELCDASMERLGTDYIDIYWIHNPADVERWTPGLISLVKSGKVKQVGVSNHNLAQIKRAEEILSKEGIHLSAVQNHYSLLYRSSEDAGILDYCKENGIDFYAYMVLEQGALSGKYNTKNPLPQGSQRGDTYNPILPQLEKLTDAMRSMGEKHGATVAQVAIAWAIAKGTRPIIGVTKPSQVEDAANAAQVVLSAEEMAQLETLAKEANVDTRGSWENPMA